MAQGARLTPEQIQRVADALEISPSWRAAADHAGIGEKSIYRYRERAEAYLNRHQPDEQNVADLTDETDPDYFYFTAARAWIEARSRLELRLVQGIVDAGPKDWKAYHAMLKSGWPQDYSDRVELTGAGGGPIAVSLDELTARAEEQLAEITRKREAAGQSTDDPPAVEVVADPAWMDDGP